MTKYIVPFVIDGEIEIEADSAEEAKSIVDDEMSPRDYVEEGWLETFRAIEKKTTRAETIQ